MGFYAEKSIKTGNIMLETRCRGFTLIELMIVVAIIGILASVAIPSYQEYMTRSQVIEAVSLTTSIKTALSDYYAGNGSFSSLSGPAFLGVTEQGKYVGSIVFAGNTGGTIYIQAKMKSSNISAPIQDKVFSLETTDGGKTWACGSQTTSAGNTIDSKYLPAACR